VHSRLAVAVVAAVSVGGGLARQAQGNASQRREAISSALAVKSSLVNEYCSVGKGPPSPLLAFLSSPPLLHANPR